MKYLRYAISISSFSAILVVAALSGACARGYVEPTQLERHNQGPTSCMSRCHQLGMRMGALVLVSNALPACVCEPVPTSGAISSNASSSSAAAGGGYVVIAEAAARAQAQQNQQRAATAPTHRR